jgi:hypothetical protein
MTFNAIPAGELIQETMLHDPPLDESNVNFASAILARVLRFININFLGGMLCASQRLLITFFFLLSFS